MQPVPQTVRGRRSHPDRVALKGLSGSLASLDLIEALVAAPIQREPATKLRSVLTTAVRVLGPASTARQVFDMLLMPFLRELDFDATPTADAAGVLIAITYAAGRPAAVVSAAGWNSDLRRLCFATTRSTAALAVRWWIGTNGATIRILDLSRAYSQRVIDLDVIRICDDDRAILLVQRLFEGAAGGSFPVLDTLVRATEQHRSAVGRSLQSGVEQALARLVAGFGGSRPRQAARLEIALGDALTVVYRILFLLFAEARGLVPQWHPIYRESYTIESLRPLTEGHRSPAGLWQSLQAIARLAHRGCRAGTLRVVPFNGRLFAPSAAPLAESFRLDDKIVREVLLALTTRPGDDRRERISYADLGVEQLGAVYEHVLEYSPSSTAGIVSLLRTGRRKSTGTFYTPRSMTEYLVRRTLAPLVRGASPERILALRVLDPSMGSGAFLVAACRYLADAYEEALVAEGTTVRADILPEDRASFRRVIAQRCLYGVDLNPTAVQLARLSLWLCTLAADRPLSFFDHHLRTGNSLAGATARDIARQPPGSSRSRTTTALPLFDTGDFAERLASAVTPRLAMAVQPDDSAAIVRDKERALEALDGDEGPLARWRAVTDAWCAVWFWPDHVEPIRPAAWAAFSAGLQGRPSGLPAPLEERWRGTAAAVGHAQRFFHWELEFPEVFYDDRGEPRALSGFDAVIGNPPWAAAGPLTAFSRESGCFPLQGNGHANLYQLFAERMLALARPHGRIGMLMPSGLLSDHGCAGLRRRLFERCSVDAVLGFDNRDALFPIHRGVRFHLLTATAGGATTDLQTRCGIRSADFLDDVPDEGNVPQTVRISLGLIRKFSGDGLAVPELRHERDRSILARVLATVPPLGSPDGWSAHFGRELNATDDRRHFAARGLPVLEGKLLDPFRVRVEEAERFIPPAVAERLLAHRSHLARPRLAYREVAASTNRLTLIAAIVPSRVVTTHTIFCLREPLDEEVQWFLCGMFNSFVANYFVRLRGGTHVPASVIHQIPVPAPSRDTESFIAIATLAKSAAAQEGNLTANAMLHAQAARLYRLDADDFAHILNTFPLVPAEARSAALSAFRTISEL
jgi:hypothetical protein